MRKRITRLLYNAEQVLRGHFTSLRYEMEKKQREGKEGNSKCGIGECPWTRDLMIGQLLCFFGDRYMHLLYNHLLSLA